MSFFNYFSDKERGSVKKATNFKNRVFGGFGPLLVRLHVHPDALSYIGLSMLIGVVIWFVSHPYRSVLLLAIYIIIDGLDGSYARYLNRPTQSGAFTDIVADQLGMVVIALGFIQYGMVDPMFGAYYIMIYLIMITFSVVQNAQGIPMQYIFRSKYILYAVYGLWAVSGLNLAAALIPAFCLVMTLSVAQSYIRLKRGIYWKYDLPKILAQEREMRERNQRPPRFWPSLNFILPAIAVSAFLFFGAYTQIMAMLEMAATRPEWRKIELDGVMAKNEKPAAVGALDDGWLVSGYNPKTRFTTFYKFDSFFRPAGSFRLPWALSRKHGVCGADGRIYIADRLSRRVFDLDLAASLERGVGVLDRSFDTTMTAPVACAIVDRDGERLMLVSEYMHHYRTVLLDHEKAFESGSAAGNIRGWYRNAGFVRGITQSGGTTFELHGSLWKEIIYVIDTRSALDNKYIRDAIITTISAKPWHAAGMALRGRELAVADYEDRRIFLTDLPPDTPWIKSTDDKKAADEISAIP